MFFVISHQCVFYPIICKIIHDFTMDTLLIHRCKTFFNKFFSAVPPPFLPIYKTSFKLAFTVFKAMQTHINCVILLSEASIR